MEKDWDKFKQPTGVTRMDTEWEKFKQLWKTLKKHDKNCDLRKTMYLATCTCEHKNEPTKKQLKHDLGI